MEILFELLLELVFQVVGEIIVELGLASFRHSLGKKEAASPILSGVGYFILGCVAGAISVWLLPRKVAAWTALPGASLIIVPVGTGTALELYGRWRRRLGKATTNLATFLGGACLSLGTVIVRRWMLA